MLLAEADQIYFGNLAADKVYLGNELIWPAGFNSMEALL
jgi:hypothetical protein